ncbi:thiamine diphosphokinase [Alphaproteobacteria bacterium]|jgi:thiamine pyrophosphokinase|nr:thiamine diphosphokinase [Alphaproteobacteria bacterium]MDA9010152.1 thiamine diphosphokinase [bacterium]MDA9056172.1 thiamine diphosphokinase [Alphaproteobacteria bacterium]MDA9825349.1 thiamine diphosphokinase [Alphaproteobacteria bacterium]MDG2490233.1 thiamine diphosphokinase [Alphaproteobacteria bacterium]
MAHRQDNQLLYSSPILLFGAAPIAGSLLSCLDHCQNWPVLAADGGLRTALSCGLRPQAVIGDMDSANDLDQLPDDIRQIKLSGQDDTDFEKSLGVISAPLIIGIGFLDGRFDHSLAALDALARLPHDRPVLLVGGDDVLLRLRGDFEMTLPLASRFSVWPLGRQHFLRSHGLEWPLDDVTMALGKRTGTSNRVIGKPVSITAGAGDGYVVMAPFTAFDVMLDAAMAIADLPA